MDPSTSPSSGCELCGVRGTLFFSEAAGEQTACTASPTSPRLTFLKLCSVPGFELSAEALLPSIFASVPLGYPTSETRESCKPGSVAQRVTALKWGPHLLDPGTVVLGIPRQEEAFGAHPRKHGRQLPFCTTSPPPPPPQRSTERTADWPGALECSLAARLSSPV